MTRVLIHDFAGHPFQAQLSRELARRGHIVTHAYCSGVTTGQGDLARRKDDPSNLWFVDVSSLPFERYSPLRRLGNEVRYGARLVRLAARTRPEVVVSANAPLLSQAVLWGHGILHGSLRVYWLQDFLGRGVRSVLRRKSVLLSTTVGRAMELLETLLLRSSSALIVISPDFLAELALRKVSTPAIVVENWAPLDEVGRSVKRNAWSQQHGLDELPVALYAGTLGLKHDPQHIVAAAEALRGSNGVVAVVSEGIGREFLERSKARSNLENLRLFDFVPYAELDDVLAASDVCMVLLESDAGPFSVPSKVLTYMAAQKPIVGAVPSENLAARTIRESGAGVVVSPGEHSRFASALQAILFDQERLQSMERSAGRYAAEHFDLGAITDRIELLLKSVLTTRRRPAPATGGGPRRGWRLWRG
jgi:colanic acid biosynthesis glycosyl transferase WcaI